MQIKIPGSKELQIEDLVLDFNGTIALDGKIIENTKEKLFEIGKMLNIHVVTADTNGSVYKECEELPIKVHIIGKENQIEEKKKFILRLGSKGVISIGNGVNDEKMFEVSALAIAIIGHEGCATSTLSKSNIVVSDINDALNLILKQNRLIATLRK